MSEAEPQPDCPNCGRLPKRVDEPEARLARLEALLDERDCSGKRQAAPFSQGRQAGPPKSAGRKSGDEHGVHRHRAVPEHIDDVHVAPLPEQLRILVCPVNRHAGNERLAKFLERHVGEIFTFLCRPERQVDGTVAFLDATNWRAEQAIRPAVVNRKVWGGNRTWQGAAAQAILTSVLTTASQHALDLLPPPSRARLQTEPALVLAAGR